MNRREWLKLLIARKWNTVVGRAIRFVSPKLYDRYITYQTAKYPDVVGIVNAMAIVGRVAIAFGLQKSPVLKEISMVLNGRLNGDSSYGIAERVLTSKRPGVAFISAVVLNGEWDRRCKYNIANPDNLKLIKAEVEQTFIN